MLVLSLDIQVVLTFLMQRKVSKKYNEKYQYELSSHTPFVPTLVERRKGKVSPQWRTTSDQNSDQKIRQWLQLLWVDNCGLWDWNNLYLPSTYSCEHYRASLVFVIPSYNRTYDEILTFFISLPVFYTVRLSDTFCNMNSSGSSISQLLLRVVFSIYDKYRCAHTKKLLKNKVRFFSINRMNNF